MASFADWNEKEWNKQEGEFEREVCWNIFNDHFSSLFEFFSVAYLQRKKVQNSTSIHASEKFMFLCCTFINT